MNDRFTVINGQLEVDHERGVIYFHLTNQEDVNRLSQITPLRISHLPTPIPQLKGFQIDLAFAFREDKESYASCNWRPT